MFKIMKDFKITEESREAITQFKYQLGKLSVDKDASDEYKKQRHEYFENIPSTIFGFEKSKKFMLPIQTATSYAGSALMKSFKETKEVKPNEKIRYEEEIRLLKEFDQKHKPEFVYGSDEGWILYKLLIEEQYFQSG